MLLPEKLKRISESGQAGQESRFIDVLPRGRCRIEFNPLRRLRAVEWKVSLDPGVRIRLPHDEAADHRIVITCLKTVDDSRGNIDAAQHYRHCSSEVLTVAFLCIEQKINERVGLIRPWYFQRVAVFGAEIIFDQLCAVIVVGCSTRDL